MRSIVLVIVAAFALLGCQTRTSTTQTAAAPKEIVALTNQTVVYSCPECGMDYESAGNCTMCKVPLVKTNVAYICPADDQPVPQAGKCPRCEVNAKVVKTVAADAGAPAPGNPQGS